MDYDLGRLGSRQFEHLSQALFLDLLGHRVGVFGDGPDGGREAAFDGVVTWRNGQSFESSWNGYVVLQAKYLVSETTERGSQQWLLRQLRRELADWANPEGRRQKKGRVPDYLIIATNVRLSSVEGGGVDAIEDLLRGFKDPQKNRGLKGWDVWHYDKLRGYLDNAADVRTAYSGLILTGDILAQLQDQLQVRAKDLDLVLTTHAAKELKSDSWVKLGQAGLAIEKQVELSQVAIDLPGSISVGDERETVSVTHHVVTHGDAVLTNDNQLNEDLPRHILIVGGPGQGKSTLSQMIAQCYRAELMRGSLARLDKDRRRLRESVESSLRRQGIPAPRNIRWPMRIDLSELADQAGNGTITLIEWMAQKLTARAAVTVQPRDLQSWLQRWPSILILDGLDEVANPYAREVVVQAIDDYLVEASFAGMDTLLVVTTRPQGYGRELNESLFHTVELESLEKAHALQCAARLAESRNEDDEDRRAEVLARVSDALGQELTARLMTTPLQVAIMFLLLENNNRPPRDRHGLFEAYYRTIYAREVNKSNPLSAQLDRHRSHVDALHEQIGLRLQSLSESVHDSDATLSCGTVESLAKERLQGQGYEEDKAAAIARDIVRATTDRLVLLVRRGGDDFGYELRSFQEYMAARAITNGNQQDVLDRLRLIAPSAHWRNTWLFAAGRIFSMPNSEHMRHPVTTLVRDLDTVSLLCMEIPVGPELAGVSGVVRS